MHIMYTYTLDEMRISFCEGDEAITVTLNILKIPRNTIKMHIIIG